MKNENSTSHSFTLAQKFRVARAKLEELSAYFHHHPIHCCLFFLMLMFVIIGIVVLRLMYFPDHSILIMFGGIVAGACVIHLANKADVQRGNTIDRDHSVRTTSISRNAGMAGIYDSVDSELLEDNENFGNIFYQADFDSHGINPATGLLMIDSAIDVAGNAYGFGDGDIGFSSFYSDAHSSFSDFDLDSISGFSSFDNDSSLCGSSWED